LPALDNVDLVVLFPNGRISEVQRRMMTTSGASNVHALAIEGNFDDCQAIVKALFNHHKLPRHGRAVGREFDQLGAHRRASGLLLYLGR
jgi:threonine synthase